MSGITSQNGASIQGAGIPRQALEITLAVYDPPSFVHDSKAQHAMDDIVSIVSQDRTQSKPGVIKCEAITNSS